MRGEPTSGFAAHPKIGPVPWVWTRAVVAEKWRCKPYEIDQAIEDGHWDEVVLTLKLIELEAQARAQSPG